MFEIFRKNIFLKIFHFVFRSKNFIFFSIIFCPNHISSSQRSHEKRFHTFLCNSVGQSGQNVSKLPKISGNHGKSPESDDILRILNLFFFHRICKKIIKSTVLRAPEELAGPPQHATYQKLYQNPLAHVFRTFRDA